MNQTTLDNFFGLVLQRKAINETIADEKANILEEYADGEYRISRNEDGTENWMVIKTERTIRMKKKKIKKLEVD